MKVWLFNELDLTLTHVDVNPVAGEPDWVEVGSRETSWRYVRKPCWDVDRSPVAAHAMEELRLKMRHHFEMYTKLTQAGFAICNPGAATTGEDASDAQAEVRA